MGTGGGRKADKLHSMEKPIPLTLLGNGGRQRNRTITLEGCHWVQASFVPCTVPSNELVDALGIEPSGP